MRAQQRFHGAGFERKMPTSLTAHAAGEHERRFGWKTFRILRVTTNHERERSMMQSLQTLNVPNSPGPSLFWFDTRAELQATNALAHPWLDGMRLERRLV